MKNFAEYFIILLLILPSLILAQTPESQISFANETKPHEYYVKQAELWWKEIERDKSSENNWYNYYRACRNSQGTLNWREDFVKESPYLKSGPDIVKLLEEFIPNTFTFYYVSYSERGIDPTKGPLLLKAYEMNPYFKGIQSEMVTYAQSVFDFDLRKKVNINWFAKNDISPGLLNYAYNVLMSVEPNSILFTQNDNDSYPVWMLQDVKKIRNDVMVINFDFLILETYREKVFKDLNIKKLDIQIDDGYEVNWKKVLTHILLNYNLTHPLYFGMTVTPKYYEDFGDKMSISGLTLRYPKLSANNVEVNKSLLEKSFLLDYLKIQLFSDHNQLNLNKMNCNYLKCFKIVYDDYTSNGNSIKASYIRDVAIKVASESEVNETLDRTIKNFK
jgi:hypothetical protein